MDKLVRTALGPLLQMFRRFFDPRFGQLDAQLQEVRAALSLNGGAPGIGAVPAGLVSVAESLTVFSSTLNRLDERLGSDEVLAETRNIRQTLDTVAYTQSGWGAWTDDMLAERPPGDLLTDRQAAFLTTALSYEGPARRSGLWFNPPVSVRYTRAGAEVSGVNERIVEVPFALAALSQLERGSTILDVGAGESTVSLSLAALGYRPIALDLHPYPFAHPDLTVVAQPLEEWAGPGAPLDAVLCLSSVEHFGLGAYGEKPVVDQAADAEAMRRLHELSAPGALLVFTAPFGRAEVQASQRVYDLAGLERLLGGWELTSVSLAQQTAPDRWELRGGREAAPALETSGQRGVALVVGRRR